MTVVYRIHGETTDSSIAGVAGLSITRISGAYYFNVADTVAAGTGNCDIAGIPAGQDILLRVIRDRTNSKVYFEIQDTQSGAFYTVFGSFATSDQKACMFTITGFANGTTIQTAGISIGGTGVTGSIASMRWYTGAATPGTTISLAAPGDLGNWNFNDDLVDSAHAQNLAPAVSGYTNTPVYAPLCATSSSQVVSINTGLTISGANSKPLDETTTLTYLWTNTAKPGGTTLALTGTTTATLGVTGLSAFGTYTFQLTVTDGSSQSNSCSVKNGAVVNGTDGVINLTAEGVPAAAQHFIGPMTKYGVNPWPWADNREKASADLIISYMANTYKLRDSGLQLGVCLLQVG
jgi:hypothetical protein